MTRPARSRGTPSVLTQRGRRDAGGPQHRSRVDTLGARHHAMRIDRGHRRAFANFDAQALQRRGARRSAASPGNVGRIVGSRLDEHDSRTGSIDGMELVAQRLSRDLGERAGKLDSGRAATDDDKGEQLTLSARVLLALRALERDEDAPPDRDRIFQRLQSWCVRLPIGVAEVRVTGTGGHDEPVVVERGAVGQFDAPRVDVDTRGIGEQNPDVARRDAGSTGSAPQCRQVRASQ